MLQEPNSINKRDMRIITETIIKETIRNNKEFAEEKGFRSLEEELNYYCKQHNIKIMNQCKADLLNYFNEEMSK